MLAILVAAKRLESAKSRLAPVLAPQARRALARAMFDNVLKAALDSSRAQAVAVVSSDPELLEAARQGGALALDEGEERGLNRAVRTATAELIARGADALCTVLSDLPLVSGADLDAVLEALPVPQGVVLVPSRDLSGTNVLARRPPDAIPARFGTASLVRHLRECERRGLACISLRLVGPALDVDVADDLAELVGTDERWRSPMRLVHPRTGSC